MEGEQEVYAGELHAQVDAAEHLTQEQRDVLHAQIEARVAAEHAAGFPTGLSADQVAELERQHAEQARQAKKKMRRQLIIGILIGGIGVLGTTMGIVGQSFSLRSARAMERVGDQLEILNAHRCEAAK